jgi:lysophospholipase L1-like esterase
MDHGELPERMEAWVFWLVLGTSDLSRGGCSEEATVLGILRVAEELEQRYPGSVVVIQGILPRTSRKDGILEPKSMHTKLIGKHHTEKYYADMAQHAYLLWPSIQVINSELEKFCEGRENIVYFDAGRLFLQDVKEKKMGKTQKIITKLMPDYVHPSPEGWMVLGEAILEEYQTIVLDENMENDIERKEEDDDAR